MSFTPLFDKINQIATQSMIVKQEKLPDLQASLDYVSIFAQSTDEYDFYVEEALKNGEIEKEVPNSLYVKLFNELSIENEKFFGVKIRKPDTTSLTEGGIVFYTNQYESLKSQFPDRIKMGVAGTERIIINSSDNNVFVGIAAQSELQNSQQVTAEGEPATQKSDFKTQNTEPVSIEEQLIDEKNKRLQLMADFQNFKKRMDNERATFGAIANMGLIQEMLEVFDDLQMAMQDSDLDLDRAKSAMQNAQSKISSAVKSAGIEPIEVKVGDEFDKTKMEAIQAVPNEEMKNKVIAVISSAYKYAGQETILKAAKVIVGK